MHNGGACLSKTRGQLFAVRRQMAVAEYHAASGNQRQIELRNAHVEGEGSQSGENIARPHTQFLRHESKQVHDRAMRNLHTLGSSS